MTFLSGEVLTVNRLEDKNSKNQLSGYCGLNASGRISFTRIMKTSNWFYWNADWRTKTAIGGTWAQTGTSDQSIYDIDLTGASGYWIANISASTGDEIKWSNIKMCAGTYQIRIIYLITTSTTTSELYHGSTLLGTFGSTGAAPSYNQSTIITYSSSSHKTEDIRIVSTGYCAISRLEIFRIS